LHPTIALDDHKYAREIFSCDRFTTDVTTPRGVVDFIQCQRKKNAYTKIETAAAVPHSRPKKAQDKEKKGKKLFNQRKDLEIRINL